MLRPSAPSTVPYPPVHVGGRSGGKLGFVERLGIGWRLTKVSLGVLRKEKGLIFLPFLSFLITGAAWGIFALSFFFPAPSQGPFGPWYSYVALAVVYFLTFFVSIFFNSAVVGAAMIRLDGGDPTIGDGLKVARRNLGRIAGWAFLSATVGLILRALSDLFGWVGRVIAGIAGVAWGVLTYLVVPVLIFERRGPWDAVKRSGSLIRQTWGEAAGGYFTLGVIFLLLAFPGFVPIVAGFLIGHITGFLVGLGIAVLYWLILALFGSAAQSILVTALYRYATTGTLGFGLPQDIFPARS